MHRSSRSIAALGLGLVLVALATPAAQAAGSQNLWPNGAPGSRANTEWRTSSYGGGIVTRRAGA